MIKRGVSTLAVWRCTNPQLRGLVDILEQEGSSQLLVSCSISEPVAKQALSAPMLRSLRGSRVGLGAW